MKARLVGVLLCIGAFVLSMLLLMHLIENPMTQVPEIMPNTPSVSAPEGDGQEDTSDLANDVTSIEGVMAVAKETQTFFDTLAFDASREADLASILNKWQNASTYLSQRAADEAGAAFYTALFNAFSEYSQALPTDVASFSQKAGTVLNTLSASAVDEEGEPSGRYPSLDTGENGAVALSLLRLWRASEKTEGSINLTFGGEVAMGDYIGASSYQNLYAVENAANPLRGLAAVFATDDLSLVSLSHPLTTYTVPEVAATEAFRGAAADAYAKHLKSAGVDAVFLSTSHMQDFGETGYADTKAALEKAGLKVVEDGAITYLDTTAGKVALLAYNLTDDGDVRYTEIPKAQIKEARDAGAKLVIPYFHMGDGDTVTAAMANTMRDAAENGADLVLSSHAAQIKGILFSGEKKTPLVLSPGHLSYAAATDPSRDTFLYNQSFSLTEGDSADASLLILPVDNHSADADRPFAPTLWLDSANVSRVQSTLTAALPNFQGRAAEGDLTYVTIQK